MTHGGSHHQLSRSERRDAAREKAQALREERRKKDRRGKLLLVGGGILAALVAAALVTVVVLDASRPPRSGPLNMLSDGIRIEEDYKAVLTAALPPEASPVPHLAAQGADVIDIQLYVDYFAVNGKTFMETNGSQLEAWIERGAATLEIHPLSLLNPNSQGTQYSTRSANAAACVANYSPDSYWLVHKALFVNQPEERTPGLSDEELLEMVEATGAARATAIEQCIRSQEFKRWVQAATLRALEGPLPSYSGEVDDENKVRGTPTILVNGLLYKGRLDDADAFAAFVLQAAGTAFNESSTSTPTPTPEPETVEEPEG